MTIDDPYAPVLTTTSPASGMFGAGPLVQPPPPTGSLVPPPPPPLAPPPPAAYQAEPDTSLSVDSAPRAEDGGQLGVDLPEGLRSELCELLGRVGGPLHAVFEQYRSGMTSPAALVAAGAAASEGTAADLTLRIRTILGEPWTCTPGRARPVAGSIRALLRTPGLSREARGYLTALRVTMLDSAESDAGQLEEQVRLDANSVVLQRELRTANGVYVYTYPHYWRYPYQAETNRRMLNVAKTTQGAWQHVLDQTRSAAAPEDPVLLRVYTAPDPSAAEQAFHRLLESADHTRIITSNGNGGWFTSTLEFLDEIARALGIEINAGSDPLL